MVRHNRNIVKILSIFISLIIICSCKKKEEIVEMTYRDWNDIKTEGVLRAITMPNTTSYFIYRGVEMGCEYELIKQFAENHNLSLEIVIANSYENIIELLQQNKGDIVVYDMPKSLNNKELYINCGPQMITHQVLVQRNDTSLIKDVKDIVGKTIFVEKGTHYELRAKNMNKELGGGIELLYTTGDTATTDGFIDAVSKGKINYTITDNVNAALNKTYYQNLNIGLEVGFSQKSAWLVNKDSKVLADSINSWVKQNNKTQKYLSTIQKYFRMSKWGSEHVSPNGMAISLKNGIISPYDHLFKHYADSIGWDWRLLASMAYNESQFDSTLVSWAGARGIMQLMPSTAKHFSDEDWDMTNNKENIAAATRYIATLNKSLRKKVEDEEERIKFILASYNSGLGHILDAIALAQKYGMNSQVWFGNTADALILKNIPEYYNDSICKCGQFKGRETIAYVEKVIELYEFYKQNMPEQ